MIDFRHYDLMKPFNCRKCMQSAMMIHTKDELLEEVSVIKDAIRSTASVGTLTDATLCSLR